MRCLHKRICAHEPAEFRIIYTAIHVDQPDTVQVFMIGETSGNAGGDKFRIAQNISLLKAAGILKMTTPTNGKN